jgi:hypothetical protein
VLVRERRLSASWNVHNATRARLDFSTRLLEVSGLDRRLGAR